MIKVKLGKKDKKIMFKNKKTTENEEEKQKNEEENSSEERKEIEIKSLRRQKTKEGRLGWGLSQFLFSDF